VTLLPPLDNLAYPLGELWCCINPGAIRDAAVTFAEFSVIDLRELEQAGESATV